MDVFTGMALAISGAVIILVTIACLTEGTDWTKLDES